MLSDWLFRVRALLGRRRVEEELEEELSAHVARQAEVYVRAGMTPAEAQRRARIEFGGVDQIKEECRDARGVRLLDDLARDVSYAARVLRRQPAFALVVLVTLTLGIGANTAIFQLLDAMNFRPLPVKNPSELVEVRPTFDNVWGSMTGRRARVTFAIWDELRRRHEPFSGVFAWGVNRFDLSTGGQSRLVDGLWVSGEFFEVLGVQAARGRVIGRSDDVRGCGAPGVVISHAFWQREFGGVPNVVGRAIHLDGHALEIVGVTPASFSGIEVGRSFDVAVPICAESMLEPSRNAVDKKHYWWLDAIGRLKPGWTIDKANTYLAGISPAVFSATVAPAFPVEVAKTYVKGTLTAEPAGRGVSYLRGQYQEPLWILLALSALVQVIACANLANLLLARASARDREIAVRLAIGASRARLVRQLLTESLLLAAIGAVLGAILARWASQSLVAFISTDAERLFFDLGINWRILAFTCGLAAATCLLFGLAPALRATRQNTAAAIKAGRGTSDTRERFGLRRGLVAVQVALSLVLVVGALLFMRTVRNLATLDAGFRTEDVLVADFDVRGAHVPAARQVAFQQELLARISAIPGVEMTANAAIQPGQGSVWNDRVIVDGVRQQVIVNENHVSPGFFRLLDTLLVSGRDFDERDVPSAPRVAIVNRAFAEQVLKTTTPIGRTFRLQVSPGDPDPLYQVIGMVANTKYNDVREPNGPIAYFAEAQDVDPASADPLSAVQMLVRSRLPAGQLTASITAASTQVSPALLVSYRTLTEDIRRGFLRERLMATLAGFFGASAALLASIGLYGMMAYMVARRRNEIGIRLALGAGHGEVIRMIVSDGVVLVAAGLTAGLGLSLAATRAAQSLLFGVTAWDPATLAAAVAALTLMSGAACALPALRASRLDPNVALREE